MAIAAAAAMIGCAGTSPTVQPPAAERTAVSDRQVMTVDQIASLEALLTELPGSIPVDQAEGLMVRIDPQLVKDGAGYTVQAAGSQATIGGERIIRGFLPMFQANYSSLYYLPYQNQYFPYYRSGDVYLPLYGSILSHGDSRVYPFFRRQWGFFYPYFYNNTAGHSFFLGVWSGTLGLMERMGAWSGVHPGSPVLLPPEMPTQPPAAPAPEPIASPEPVPTETPEEEPTAAPEEEPTATPEEEPTATPEEEPTATPEEEPTATPEAEPTETETPAETGAEETTTEAGAVAY